MKTYCKHIDVEDITTIYPFVLGCFNNKWRRTDFQVLLRQFSVKSAADIRRLIEAGKKAELYGDVKRIAEEIVQRIRARDLHLDPVVYSQRRDGMNGKLRTIGVESVLHQCFDHVAVEAMRELFEAKAGYYQCASIKGKGQVFGKNAIQRFIEKDRAAIQHAQEHGRKYSSKSVYFVKVDVRKCYPSLRYDIIMRLLERDIHKNKTLLWLVSALLEMHTDGLIIGSLLSQFLCNYALSYPYREMEQLHKQRRKKRIPLVHFQLFYMDDILLIGSSRHDLKTAVRHLERYMRDNLGLSIKPTWHVKELACEPIDMMGFVLHSNGCVTIRSSIFLRARRAFMLARGHMNLEIARRVVSYHGYFAHADSVRITRKLHVDSLSQKAQRYISHLEKGKGSQYDRASLFFKHASDS